MSDHSHHHGHDEHGGDSGPISRWYFEVPIALGAALWMFIIMLININSCPKECAENCCEEGENCVKTEMPAGSGEHH